MIGQLVEYGYKMVDNPEDADLVLINSCTVVNPSQTAFINMVCKAKKIMMNHPGMYFTTLKSWA